MLHPVPDIASVNSGLPDRRVCVLGLGYVGLPTALLFARHGYTVAGVDINPVVMETLANGRIPEVYPELTGWWNELQNNPNQQLSAHLTPPPSDVFLITVPTPVDPQTHACDLDAVRAATRAIVPILQAGNLVILESTVPPGTTRQVVQPILEESGLQVGETLDLCFSPERILPGNTVQELTRNARLVGGVTPEAAQRAARLFGSVIEGEIHTTDDRTAEFCKLAENTYRDVNIALANELAMVADAHGVDIQEAIPLINHHPRVNVLKPGIGVGGHCIAVDPWFFVELEPTTTRLIHTARQVNDGMPGYRVQQILADLQVVAEKTGRPLTELAVCAAGLTYKPDVADMRESPAMEMVRLLSAAGVQVKPYDPLILHYNKQTLENALHGTDYLAVLVSHQQLLNTLGHAGSPERQKVLAAMRTPMIRFFG